MLSYSDYLGRKETLEQEEVQEYIALSATKRPADQGTD
ncbi:MAG: hypothetical protein ACLUJR_11895 [Mediterraneibacter gnavus]